MAHRRRLTKGLDTNEVKELDQAWRFAPFIRTTPERDGHDPADRYRRNAAGKTMPALLKGPQQARRLCSRAPIAGDLRLVAGEQSGRNRRTHACSHPHACKASREIRRVGDGVVPRPGRGRHNHGDPEGPFHLGWEAPDSDRLSRQADDASGLVQARPNPEERRSDRREA